MLTAIRRFLLCTGRGHLRGKPITETTNTAGPTVRTYECPRCGTQWSRKVYAKAVGK